jgi:hypothetical protein
VKTACDRRGEPSSFPSVPYLPFRIALFLSSFSPLFGLLAYENCSEKPVFWILVAAIVIGIVGLVLVLFSYRTEGPRIRATSVMPKDGDVLAYIATYLIPFLGIDLSQMDDLIAFAVFLVVLGGVYINSNMLFVNPLLSFAGYHAYEVVDLSAQSYTIISRQRLEPDSKIVPAIVTRHLRVEGRWRRSAAKDTERNA